MTVALERERTQLYGVTRPRIAPPEPAYHLLDEYEDTARAVNIELRPWQREAAKYLTAVGEDGWTFREVCIVVGRQNGKTELLIPRILMDLRAGKRILHTAQVRSLPRELFLRLPWMLDPEEVWGIRSGNGQEAITMQNGGEYRIVAKERGSRGLTADTIIIDELREVEDNDIIAAMAPTLTASPDWQSIYLSNAGTHQSLVLNGLRRRGEAGEDSDLAYVEWSADPERSIDDRQGWLQANPSVGYGMRIETIEHFYNTYKDGSPNLFQVEHLCQWVDSMMTSVVGMPAWLQCQATIAEKPNRPALAFNMDPTGKRASAVIAWQMTDGRIALREVLEGTGHPIDTRALGEDLNKLKTEHGAKKAAFASWTDKDLARYVRGSEALDGKEFAAASEHFARVVMQGRLAWDDARHITDDVQWAARKPHESGAWIATPDGEHAITAFLAAVRAVWLASAPRVVPRIG